MYCRAIPSEEVQIVAVLVVIDDEFRVSAQSVFHWVSGASDWKVSGHIYIPELGLWDDLNGILYDSSDVSGLATSRVCKMGQYHSVDFICGCYWELPSQCDL
jgi:hypothetical protein